MREYLRVEASFPILYYKIPEGETEDEIISFRKEIFWWRDIEITIRKFRAQNVDPQAEIMLAILKVLRSVDMKLSRITGDLPQKKFEKGEVKDISGGGVKFLSKENISGLIKIKFQIPVEPYYEIQAIARVIESSSTEGGFLVRAEFTHILEADREEVVKFTVASQRKLIKEKKPP